ncbi:MAG TPA: radical SAM protein [Bryobacteraceae bacterium]|nr:radical SAM protein [Bryobacteraceae bacterium]
MPLGPAFVAAACRRAGHEAVLLNLMFERDPVAALQKCVEEFRPEVIGISVRNVDDQNMASPKFLLTAARDVVATCRRLSGAPIVVGGPGYSMFPESALRFLQADMGIRGEGETVFPELLERLESRADPYGLPGVYLPEHLPAGRLFSTSLDDLPLPEPELWLPAAPESRELWIPVQGKRGCPMGCSYCATKVIEGTRIRRRSPESIVQWMELVAARGFRNFCTVDNTFNIPPSYAKGYCREIIRRGLDINLWCIVYPKWVDRELAELMARAGCHEVSLGFESGSDCVLTRFHKKFRAEEVRAIAAIFRDAGIRRTGFLMLGGPGETRETVEEGLAFADSLDLDALRITVGIRIYPETDLAATAVAEGVIAPDDDLLRPTFYLAAGLKDWLPAKVADYRASRSWVM